MRTLRACLAAVFLLAAWESPGATLPPGGLDRFCCLHPLPSGKVLFLDAVTAELWLWDGQTWARAAQLPPLPCVPQAFATDPAVAQVAVPCTGSGSTRRPKVLITSLKGEPGAPWRELPPVPLADVTSLAFHRQSWEVAGPPCALGRCGPEPTVLRRGATFPTWFRWEMGQWQKRGTATWDPQWEKLAEAACKVPQLSHPKPCQRYPDLAKIFEAGGVASYGLSSQRFLLAATSSGNLWAASASGRRLELLSESGKAADLPGDQGPQPLAEAEMFVSLSPAPPTRSFQGVKRQVQGLARLWVPVERFLAAAALGEELYLLQKTERWELVVAQPQGTWTVSLPTSQELCHPGPFPGPYGRCFLAVGPSFVVTGPPWVVVPLPEGWNQKPENGC